MKDKESDDFFGIEYVSSQQDSQVDVRRKEMISNNNTNTNMISDKQIDAMDGTEFIDHQFFPQLKSREYNETQKDENIECSESLFEKEFFTKQHDKGTLDQMEKKSEEYSQRKKRNEKISDDRRSGQMTRENNDGLRELRNQIDAIWEMNQDEILNMMTKRVVYKDDNIIAVDKPYGMAYSSAPDGKPQFDRILQQFKSRVANKCERLHLVKSVDKHTSGILLFATSSALQKELINLMKEGQVENVYRCIVRGKLQTSPVNITIPLIKQVKDRNMKFVPLTNKDTKSPIHYGQSICHTISYIPSLVSNIEVKTYHECSHQVRAHLGLSSCPLLGDIKYNGNEGHRLPSQIYKMLNISENQGKKLPMYIHLKEMNITMPSSTIKISAPMPAHFIWMLNKFKLLRR